ncbi:MAG: TnpV protein [Oscillospiraceae bacterium]|nr:TnpV protein [Oscillospiraceae bacterium]
MAENNITKDPQFQKEQARAAVIGKYAVYRYTYIAISQRSEYKRLKANNMLWKHLRIVQNTVREYMNHFTQNIINSEEYRTAEAKDKERALKILANITEAEEERIGNKWICVKNPYESKTFCRWSEAVTVFKYRAAKTESPKKDIDVNNIEMVFGFNKYGEYSMADVCNGEVTFPLEMLYKSIYLDIKMLEEESLSPDERVEILHRRREREDHIYKFMKMRESIEKSYSNMKK